MDLAQNTRYRRCLACIPWYTDVHGQGDGVDAGRPPQRSGRRGRPSGNDAAQRCAAAVRLTPRCADVAQIVRRRCARAREADRPPRSARRLSARERHAAHGVRYTLLLDASTILAAFDSDDDLHTDPLAEDSHRSHSHAHHAGSRSAARQPMWRSGPAWRAPGRVAPAAGSHRSRIAGDGGVVPLHDGSADACGATRGGTRDPLVYDAAYVAAAGQTGGTLVSCDARDLVGKGLASSPADAHSVSAPTDSQKKGAR